ncbi:MAG: hypothetical protein V1882_06340 [Candidatus Omnitrophota bacterium]
MKFQDFLTEMQTLKVEESRAHSEDYFEAVVSKEGLASLHKVLTDYFGPPLKPEGQFPCGKANQHAKPYGGIRKEQTMYFRQDADYAEYAFLWPWGNGVRVTIKVIQSKSFGSGPGWKDFLKSLFTPKP